MYIVSYNLKRLFKWISDTTNRKWRDRKNGKTVGKKNMLILCLDAVYWGRWGGPVGGGLHKLTSKGRFPSPILNFESPLIMFNLPFFLGFKLLVECDSSLCFLIALFSASFEKKK